MQHHFMAADEQGDHQRDAEDELQRGPEHGHEAREEQRAADVLAVGVLEGGDLRILLREGADETCAGEVLLGLRGDVREHGLDALKAAMDARAEVLHQHGREGQWQKGEEGEARADAQHEGHGRCGEDQRVGRVHDSRAEQLADRVQVIGAARHDVAGAVALEELGRLGFEVSEEIVAEVELDLARGADEDLAGEIEKDSRDDGDGEQAQRVVLERGAGEVVLDVAGGVADEQRDQDLGEVVDDQRETAPDVALPVAAKIGKERAEAGEHRGELTANS